MIVTKRFSLVWFLVLTALLAGDRSWAEEARRPLIAWFGGYQKLTFDDEIAWPLDLNAESHYAGPVYYHLNPCIFGQKPVL